MKVNSSNSQSFLSDDIAFSAETFRSTLLGDLSKSVVLYAERVKNGGLDNSDESFMEFLKFTPSAVETTRVSASRSQSVLNPGGAKGGKNSKVYSDDDMQMIAKISKGTWGWNWKETGCQKFSVVGKSKNTFCGSNVVRGSNFCSDCVKLKSIAKIMQENDPFDPVAWKEAKIAAVYKKFDIQRDSDEDAPAPGEKKVVREGPPTGSRASTSEVNQPRPYKGKGVEPGQDYYWIHVDTKIGGFVIDSDNNLVGVSRVCTQHGNVVAATEEQQRRFETMANKIPSQSSRVQAPAKGSSVLRAPAMPKSVTKKKIEEEVEQEATDSDSAEAIDDSE